MLKHLLDPKQFWGEFVIPSISRDDPAFRPESQQSWRGAVRPLTNYLVYQGLKAYGFDAVAVGLRPQERRDVPDGAGRASASAPESFDSRHRRGGGASATRAAGPWPRSIAIEEYLDFTPHEGFRFGMLKPDAKGTAVPGRSSRAGITRSRSRTRRRSCARKARRSSGPTAAPSSAASSTRESGGVLRASRPSKRPGDQAPAPEEGQVPAPRRRPRGRGLHRAARVEFEVPAGDHSVLDQLLEDLEKQNANGIFSS